MKKLIVVDSNVTAGSPSMRAWLKAAPAVVLPLFDEVEVWSMQNELVGENVRWRKFPAITGKWPLDYPIFLWLVRRAYRQISREERAVTVVQCTGEVLPEVDVRYLHYWNLAFLRAAVARPLDLVLGWKERFFARRAASREKCCVNVGATKVWWCVSGGIADCMREDARAAGNEPRMEILPNTYDPERFSRGVREQWRGAMREKYGFAEDEVVLVFASFGHFARKGLRQAVEVVAKLRAGDEKLRLLVLGGKDEVIASFREDLKARGISEDGVVWAGLVADAERHLSVAEGLFFPSHFEAFSLVEIEAAALGVRLYLTGHPGHEMILREGGNGRLLPWEVEGMAAILREEIRSGAIWKSHEEMGEALTPRQYEAKLAAFYGDVIREKLKV